MTARPHTLPLLVLLVLIAFAGNSLLTRAAIGGGQMGAMPFAALRLASGALALAVIVLWRDGRFAFGGTGRLGGALSLALYMVGFSMAYVALDSGVGALILFAGVQVVMFSGALIARETVPAARWLGAALALAGLCWLLWPTGSAAPSLVHAALMGAAALGWGLYSLIGRRSGDPLGATAANFVLAAPLIVAALWLMPADPTPSTWQGIALAIASGVFASGLGYALWYTVLPRLAAATAALLQLTVPVLAALGGTLFLTEPLTARFAIAATLVGGGMALGVLGAGRR